MDKPLKLELGENEKVGGNTAEKRMMAAAARFRRQQGEQDMENIYTEDPGKLDMIGNLTSSRLLEISERFDMYPNGQVDCE